MKTLLIDQIAKVNYRYTYPLANGLSSAGIDVHLVIDGKPEKENLTCRITNAFNTADKDIGKVKKLINYIASYRKICNIVKVEQPEIFHTQWYNFSPLDYYFINRIKKKYKLKYIATVHDILPFNEKRYDMFFHKKLYALADSIILQAPVNMQRFADLFPKDVNKTHMIPHGHMLDYVEIADKNESKKRLNLSENKKVIFFFGQIKKVKGVDVLLRAYSKVRELHKDAYLVIAGSVWKSDFTECQQIIDDNNLADDVRCDIRFIPDEEVKYYYSAADICVLPYTDVYQSGVIQLTYGYKKPVVATSLPAFTQFVKEGETGYLATPNDENSLADALGRALDADVDTLTVIGQNGYELVKKELNWNDLADKIVKECYQV